MKGISGDQFLGIGLGFLGAYQSFDHHKKNLASEDEHHREEIK